MYSFGYWLEANTTTRASVFGPLSEVKDSQLVQWVALMQL